jgi:hypothetical protein
VGNFISLGTVKIKPLPVVTIIKFSIMGVSIGAVIIRQNPQSYDSGQIVGTFFGNFKELQKEELNKFDCRRPECVAIYKTRDNIIINSSKFVEGFYNQNSQSKVQEICTFFKNPKQIFSFEEYDSGGTYSYSISIDCKLLRYYRSISYDSALTFGEPLNIERKWLQAERIVVEEDGEQITYITNPDTKERVHESAIHQMLLREVMVHEVGFTSWDLEKISVEERYFTLLA